VVEISTPVEEPEPGKIAECDWATITIDFKNRTRRKLQIFGYTLASARSPEPEILETVGTAPRADWPDN
jgi:hypothetical protein